MKSVERVSPIESFLPKICAIYSQSAKLQRIKELASALDDVFCKIGGIFTTRCISSSFHSLDAVWKNYPALYEHFTLLSSTVNSKESPRTKK